jgi:hypothetical protein
MKIRDVSEENLPIYTDINKFLEKSDSFEPNSWDYSPEPKLKHSPKPTLCPSIHDLIKNGL